MKRSLKLVLLVFTSLSVTTAPIVSLAAPKRGFFGQSTSRRLQSAAAGQSSTTPQFNASVPSTSFNLGTASGAARRTVSPGRFQSNGAQLLPQFVPNRRPIWNGRKPVATPINRNVVPSVAPRVITSTSGDKKPNPTGQVLAPAGLTKLPGKLTVEAQTLVKNLAKKDQILKLKKDFLAVQKNVDIGDLPKLQEAQKYAQKCLSLNPKCAWWIPWYYHCYWNTCHGWCWNYWQPCHFYVIHCHAAYSYYFGAELYTIPGIGLGVASVNSGSPAENAGLVAGDMIISANGQPLQALDSNAVMKHVIRTSGGVLKMEVLKETSDQPVMMTAFLQKVYHHSY